MSLLLTLLGWFLKLIFREPSPEAVQAAKAASAQTTVEALEKADADVQKAVAASATATRAIDTDDKLRQYERTDPNNRDNG